MSTTTPDAPAVPETTDCPRCGAPVPADQEWCLECGAAARTRIMRPSGWRVPLAIVLGVVLLAGIGAAIAFVKLSDDASTSATSIAGAPPASAPSTPATGTPSASVPATSTPSTTDPVATVPTPPLSSGAVGSWPAGRSAWTVVLLSTSGTRAEALKAARKLTGNRHGDPVGILASADFPTLAPGFQVVFSGQYPTLAAARKAAERWHGQGSNSAYARFVSPTAPSSAPAPASPGGAPPTTGTTGGQTPP